MKLGTTAETHTHYTLWETFQSNSNTSALKHRLINNETERRLIQSGHMQTTRQTMASFLNCGYALFCAKTMYVL